MLADEEGPPAEKVAVALPTPGVKTTTVVLGAALRLEGTVMLLVGLRIGLEKDPVPFAAEYEEVNVMLPKMTELVMTAVLLPLVMVAVILARTSLVVLEAAAAL